MEMTGRFREKILERMIWEGIIIMKMQWGQMVSMLCICIALCGVQAMAVPETGDVVVARQDCKTYIGVGKATGAAGRMPKGMVRSVRSISGKFCQMRIDGRNVWVNRKNVVSYDDVVIRVTARTTSAVYAKANTASKRVTSMTAGTTRRVLGYSGSFYRVKVNGKKGWIPMSSRQFVIQITDDEPDDPTPPDPQPEPDPKPEPDPQPEPVDSEAVYAAIADTAKTKLGCAYQYGGAGPNAFDSSGFTYYCYRQHGIRRIPRTTAGQYNSCTKAAREALKPGYLVFFDCSGDGIADLVCLYIGDGKFVGANHSGTGVVLNDLNSHYYSTRFVSGGYFSQI